MRAIQLTNHEKMLRGKKIYPDLLSREEANNLSKLLLKLSISSKVGFKRIGSQIQVILGSDENEVGCYSRDQVVWWISKNRPEKLNDFWKMRFSRKFI